MQLKLLIILNVIILIGTICKAVYVANVLDYTNIYKNSSSFAKHGIKCLLYRVYYGYCVSIICYSALYISCGYYPALSVLLILAFYQIIFVVVKRTNGHYLTIAASKGYFREALKFNLSGLYSRKDIIILSDLFILPALYFLSFNNDWLYAQLYFGIFLFIIFLCFAYYKSLLPTQLINRIAFIELPVSPQDVIIAFYGIMSFQLWSFCNEYFDKVTYASSKKFFFPIRNKAPSILFINFESLDSNVIGLQENSSLVCPTLTELKENSIYFPFMLSMTGNSPSADAYVSQYNSILPPLYYPLTVREDHFFPHSIISNLSQQGYDTMSIFGFTSGFDYTLRAFSRMGFQSILYGKNNETLRSSQKENFVSDEVIYSVVNKKFRERKKPIFCHISTTITHSPWNDGIVSGLNNSYSSRYIRCLKKSDYVFKEFIENFRKENPEVFIVIVGDHGPAIDAKEIPVSRVKICGYKVDFVPIFILTPDGVSYQEKSIATTCLDIVPTIANITGGNYILNTNGQSLILNSIYDSEIDLYGKRVTRSMLFQIAEETRLRGNVRFSYIN